MNRCVGMMVAFLSLPYSALAADEGIPAKKLAQLKAATVYVKVEAKEGTGTGSGFLIRVDGDTGLVVTNQHVIREVRGRFTPQKIELVFGSGTKNERILPAEVVAADREADLAVLKVAAKNLPTPLDIGLGVELRETMTVYTFGFPLGELLSPDKTNPAMTIGKATISSLRENEHGKLKRVQLDGELNPGNSGGPVVDPEGKLIGIAVSKIVGTKISFAIPSEELSALLNGRPAALLIRSIRVEENGEAEVEIEVPYLDPLRRIKAIEVRHVRKDALKEALQPDKEGIWPALPGAEKAALKLEGGTGTVKLRLKGEKKSIDYAFQAVCTNGDGKPVAVKPLYQAINFAAPGVVSSADLKTGQGTPWEVVTSKEGGFTVEMPAPPKIKKSKTRGQPGSSVDILMIGCETEDGTYLALRVAYPTAVVKGAEDHLLDAERDALVKEWNGRLIGEKKLRGDGIIGREYTIRANLPEGAGVVMLRVRQYAAGKAVYIVAVMSASDAELPDDTGRFLSSLAIGEGKTRVDIAPPEPRGRELASWGRVIDPDQDCEFRPDDKTLSVKVPGTLHDLHPDLGKFNAPRIMKAIEGNFVLNVKVTGDFQPGGTSTNPRGIPYNGAGILIWIDEANFIRLERAAVLRNGRVTTYVGFEERTGGKRGVVNSVAFPAGTCYLRLERKGKGITGAISSDGSTWKELKTIETTWPEKLQVGVAAINSSSESFTLKFEEFRVKENGREKAEPK